MKGTVLNMEDFKHLMESEFDEDEDEDICCSECGEFDCVCEIFQDGD